MSYKFLTISILLCWSSLLFAQDTIITHPSRYKTGIKIQSETCYDNLSSDDGEQTWSGGIPVIRNFRKSKSSLETGIYIINRTRLYGAEIPGWAGSYYQPLTFYYQYLSIPLNFRLDTKSIYFSTGFNFEYLLNHSKEFPVDDQYIYNNGEDRKFVIGFNCSLGFEKSVSKTLSLFAEGRFTNTFSSQKIDDGGLFLTSGNIGTTYQTLGFGFGVNYKFL